MKLSGRGFLGTSLSRVSALLVLISTASYSAAAAQTPSMGEAKFVNIDGTSSVLARGTARSFTLPRRSDRAGLCANRGVHAPF